MRRIVRTRATIGGPLAGVQAKPPAPQWTLRETARQGAWPFRGLSRRIRYLLVPDDPELGLEPELGGLPDGELPGDELPDAPEDEPLPDVDGGVDELLLGELAPEPALPAAPDVPVADGLEDEPEVPSVELFELPVLLLLDDGVEEDDFAGALAPPEDEPLVPLLPLSPQPTSARTPSAVLVIKNSFRMYSPPEPKSCNQTRLVEPSYRSLRRKQRTHLGNHSRASSVALPVGLESTSSLCSG
jgi:hypothetical protein